MMKYALFCVLSLLAASAWTETIAEQPIPTQRIVLDWSTYPVAHVDLSETVIRQLWRYGIITLGDVFRLSEAEFAALPKVGLDSLVRLKSFLARRRISWRTPACPEHLAEE